MVSFNLLDWVIVLAVLIAVGNGYRRGLVLSLAQYAGMLGGVLVGAALGPAVTDALQIRGASRALAAALILLTAGSIGSGLGFRIGEPIRKFLRARAGRGRLEGLLGSIFSAAAVLAIAWFLGLTFARGPSADVARAIQGSTIVRTVDALAPRPPGFLSRVEAILSGVPFPPAFSGLEPLLPPLLPPSSVDTPGIRAAAAATVRVSSSGCGGTVFGSGYPLGGGQVITNAHVVAGTRGHRITTPDGQALAATVVLFDPNRDVAILNVPNLRSAALATADAGRGTQGAVIGYPGGGAETISAAVVRASTTAEGRDIYGQNVVVRQIWIVQATVRPGDSGGPLVDRDGNAIGLVFGASTTDPSQAYALTDAETAPDIQQARGRSQPVGVGPCAL